MKKLPVYLCGPINECTDDQCKNWREKAKALYPNCIDPMRRDYRGREDECIDEIVELDKRDIKDCSIVLVMYDKPSVGTSMEILYAWYKLKPVIVIADPTIRLSPWLKYHSDDIVPDLETAITKIEELNEERGR